MFNLEKQRISGDMISKDREEEKRQKEAIKSLVKEVEQLKNKLKHTKYDKSELIITEICWAGCLMKSSLTWMGD